MKTAFIGAGKGCRGVLEMFERGQLAILDLEILVVVDIDPDAPGIQFAKQKGWATSTSIEEALRLEDLGLVIELTGSEAVLEKIYAHLPPGIRVMDHVMARVFWDLEKQLEEKTELQSRQAADRAELQEILNTIPDVVMVVDDEMRILRVNRQFKQLINRSWEELVGAPFPEVVPADAGSGVDFSRSFRMVQLTGHPVTLIQFDQLEDGSKYFEVTATPIHKNEQIARVVHTSHEITEQVMLKRETEEWARRFKQIVDAVHAIITIKDLDGRYQLVNPRAEQLFGLSQQEMVGRTAGEVLPAAAAAVITRNDRECIREGGYHVAEERLRLGGEKYMLMSERMPLTDYSGEVVGLCCVARDETQARKMQNDLLLAERLAAVGKLAAGVAHELNNPLTGILTFAEDLLGEAEVDDPLREDYQLIVNEALRCRRIVRDLLDFSRRKAPERYRTSILPVATRALKMVERQASFHNITFDVVLPEALPDVNIDQAQIQQAILNLVINARDAMDGAGTLGVRGEAVNGAVALSISDTGSGIPDEVRRKIFEPFFSTKGERGNGLGLPSVKSIVEEHGGRVEVESEVGRGSTFRIVLPSAQKKER